MNRIIIYLISAFVAISGTFIANKLQLKKATKPLHRHIEHLQKDSTLKFNLINKMAKDSTLRWQSDSLKSELIKQMQSTFFELKKQNRDLSAEVNLLRAWKLDAQDGVITDTVNIEYKTNIFGIEQIDEFSDIVAKLSGATRVVISTEATALAGERTIFDISDSDADIKPFVINKKTTFIQSLITHYTQRIADNEAEILTL
jgi:hypothetical protein